MGLLTVLLATCKIDKLTKDPPPLAALSVAPGRVLDSAAVGSTAMHVDSIALTSSGAGALAWSASVKVGGGWLDVTPKTGTTPARVHVHLNPAGLDPGVYQDTVVVSAGQAVGSPARVPVDFVVAGSGPPPGPPAALAQFQNDGVTAVEPGGTLTSRSAVFKATVSGPAGSSPVRLEVEVKAVGTAFTGTSSGSGASVAGGGTASATVGGLSDNTAYHWQARAVDQGGGTSAWVSFGGNAETDPDFRVALAGTQLVFTVQPVTTIAGAPIAPAVRVAAQDPQGNTVTSFTGDVVMTFGTNTHGGLLSGTKTVAAVAGVATFADLSVDKAGGGYTLQATAGSLTAPSQSFTISPAAAAKLAFTVQPSMTQAGATITPAVRVIARDPFGNTATGFTGGVTLAISTNPSGGALHGTIPVAAAAGVASFGDLSIDKAGTGYVLKATSGTLTFATSDAFNITPPPAPPPPPPPPPVATVDVTPATASIQVNQTVQLTATPKDASGNPLAGRAVTWTSGNTSIATVNTTGLVTGKAAGSATITATSEGKNGTATVTVTAPPPPPNTAPSVNAGGNQTVLLALGYQLNASFTDPDNGPWHWTVNWGDGTSTSGNASSPGPINPTHTYVLGSFTITVTVTDSQNASGSDSKVLTVL